ncbi:Undecaprenyl-phosphate mannosyltransferase [Thalassoglobus neptunius]|uniref:Undecaprenyl-phosphate mannosyltransferase n=1 Tax=Thalassoglobus neptunius TaxID=1938619 RepID=A0A5C5X8R1_9PLAN|nr:polyprenol monophosphomannose synthase [Thalassoglobus neptunius]TWT58683.1 Undecaprenyl-phosphate mannosyltransferase [Thalassoglobus neptunius]
MMSGSLLVTLCTYNERENLEQLIPEIFEYVPEASILVVDDNSPDGTGEYVDELARENSKIHAIHRSGKLGLGTATVAAFNYGIENKFDLLLNLDADFSHPPRFMPSMIEKTDEYDVVIGSRYVPGGEIVGWGAKRHFMSRGINFYAKAMLGLKTLDNSGSFRCYRVSKLAEVDWSQSKAKGYAFQEEILYRLRRVGATFAEVPITFEERRFGVTKINMKEAVSAAWVLMSLRFRS